MLGFLFVKLSVPGQSRKRLPDARYQEATNAVGGQFYGLLLAEETWVHRRVETVDMLSTQFLRRSVSVDFTVPEGIRDSLAIADSRQSVVPLSTLAKRPLRNFDLRDENGAAVPVLGRDHNGPLAHSTLLGVVRRALVEADHGGPSEGMNAGLRRIATGDPAEAAKAISCMVEAREDDDECAVILADDAALFLLADLADNYVLVALCDDVSKRRVLKFSYEEPLATVKPGLLERLGWRPLLFELDAPGASRGASYHAEIVVPEELRFDASFIVDMDSGRIYAEDGDADRAALHAARVPLGARTALWFGLRAERADFPVAAFTVAWVTALLLLTGIVVGHLDPSRADSAVTILLAASALFAGALARSGEHRVVQALFTGPRLVLAGVAISALSAGAALSFDLSSSAICIVWWVAGLLSLLAAAMLTVTLVAARPIAPGKRK